MKNPVAGYIKKFSEVKLWRKLGKYGRQLGIKSVYTVLLLFYAFRRKDTPSWAKRIILGVLGYLIMPIDAIPDLSPIIGYTDDLGMLSFGLVTIAAYINDEVREQAKKRLKDWFGEYNALELKEVDEKL
ncbi:MAG: YkvA family protein [Saprospiraceae bacterium]|nr:YkvA family protein [Saprospiraceae bacterium]